MAMYNPNGDLVDGMRGRTPKRVLSRAEVILIGKSFDEHLETFGEGTMSMCRYKEDWGDRRIGAVTGCPADLVGSLRRELYGNLIRPEKPAPTPTPIEEVAPYLMGAFKALNERVDKVEQSMAELLTALGSSPGK